MTGGRPSNGGLDSSPVPVYRESSRPAGARPVRLILPLPPSPNRVQGWGTGRRIREKLAYKSEAWLAAVISDCRPLHPDSIPRFVRIEAVLYVKQLMDEDALGARLKWVIDCLKWKQDGPCKWKQGIMDERAYIWDDDPAHCTLARPTQRVDRKKPRVELGITALDMDVKVA